MTTIRKAWQKYASRDYTKAQGDKLSRTKDKWHYAAVVAEMAFSAGWRAHAKASAGTGFIGNPREAKS